MKRTELAAILASGLSGRVNTIGTVEDGAPDDETGFAGFQVQDSGKTFTIHVYDGEPATAAASADEAETEEVPEPADA